MPVSPTKKGISQLVAMEYVWEVLVAVALPPTLFALLGRWLDQRYHLPHVFTLGGFVLSLFVVYRLALEKGKKLKQLYEGETPTDSSSRSSHP